MKSIEEYMHIPYRMEIVEDADEGGFAVSIPQLRGCVSCGDALETAMQNIRDAKRTWLEVALEEGYPIPEPDNADEYSGQFKLRIPKSLHKELAEHSKREGISMNQYCLYLLTRNSASAQSAGFTRNYSSYSK